MQRFPLDIIAELCAKQGEHRATGKRFTKPLLYQLS
jgi:hypothetical protein